MIRLIQMMYYDGFFWRAATHSVLHWKYTKEHSCCAEQPRIRFYIGSIPKSVINALSDSLMVVYSLKFWGGIISEQS